eukprot:6241397-Pyramimonas_sp.AAC.1
MWWTEHMKDLMSSPVFFDACCDFCQYHAPWKKATRLAVWHGGSPPSLCKRCSGKHGICSMTNKRRIELSGNAPGGRKWTSIAT